MSNQLLPNDYGQFTIQNSNIQYSVVDEQTIKVTNIIKKAKCNINPKISILQSSMDPQKSKLQIYKQHLINIQIRKQAIPVVPQPSIISCFNVLKQRKNLKTKKQKLRKENQSKRKQYEKLKKIIDKYIQIYESKEESMKQKLLLSKILTNKLQSQFDKTKDRFKQLQFSKIMILAHKKLYFYQLAEIFFNQNARGLFSLQNELGKTDEQMGICLGYLGFLIENVAKILRVSMWLRFKFKGPRSTITIYDPKIIQNMSSISNQGLGIPIVEQTFLLHPKENRLNQALLYLQQQLRQIMKYNIGLNANKSSNFYELCEDLSKYLLNV